MQCPDIATGVNAVQCVAEYHQFCAERRFYAQRRCCAQRRFHAGCRRVLSILCTASMLCNVPTLRRASMMCSVSPSIVDFVHRRRFYAQRRCCAQRRFHAVCRHCEGRRCCAVCRQVLLILCTASMPRNVPTLRRVSMLCRVSPSIVDSVYSIERFLHDKLLTMKCNHLIN